MNHIINANLTLSIVNHGAHVCTMRLLYWFLSLYDVVSPKTNLNHTRAEMVTARMKVILVHPTSATIDFFFFFSDCISRATFTLPSFLRTLIFNFHRNAIFHILIMLRVRTKKKKKWHRQEERNYVLLCDPEVSCVKCVNIQVKWYRIGHCTRLAHLISVTQHYYHCRRSRRTILQYIKCAMAANIANLIELSSSKWVRDVLSNYYYYSNELHINRHITH